MSTATETAQEFYGSLNGYEELAIKKEFGSPVHVLATDDKAAFARALVMVHQARDGKTVREAFKAAMELPTLVVQDTYWADGDDEVDDLGEARPA